MKIGIPSKNKIVLTNLNKIQHLTVENGIVIIHLDTQKLYSDKSLLYFEKLLPQDDFCRIHLNTIINVNFVKTIYKNKAGGYCEMINNELLSISRRKYKNLIEKYLI